jgi:ADP-ribosylation factor-like protein 8
MLPGACSGKTTLLNVLAYGHPVETCPTIGLNVKTVRKGGVQMKCWDVGGQQQYRNEWGRYTRGCDVILFVVDTAAVRAKSFAFRKTHVISCSWSSCLRWIRYRWPRRSCTGF